MKSNVQLLLEYAQPPLTREKEQGLFHELELIKKRLNLQHDKHRIVITLTRANIPLVIGIAQRQQCPGVSLEDFVTEGLSKLLRCINTFDYKRGNKFSTYLYYSLVRMYAGFIVTEQKRNMGKVEDKDEFLQHNYLTFNPVDPGLYDLRMAVQENKANLTDIELFLIKHNYGIGEEPKTMNQLKLLIGSRLSSGRLQEIIAGAIEKLREVLVENDNDNKIL